MTAEIFETRGCFSKVMQYHGLTFTGKEQWRVAGFPEHNFLVDINACFSNKPSGDIVDRTNTIRQPWRLWKQRIWSVPADAPDLETCFQKTVIDLESRSTAVNLFYSGGIDSTAMVTAFLKHSQGRCPVRVLYSTYSVMENPGFFLTLQQSPLIEMVDFSGEVYLTQNLDGVFVTADGADDLTASLDDSFFNRVGYQGLWQSWKEFFWNQTKNSDLIDFCEHWFAQSGHKIHTVLEARWWFYTITKIQKFPASTTSILQDHQGLAVGFYDNAWFESYMYFNQDKIIPCDDYRTYKQFLKDYIWDYNRDNHYRDRKTKVNSGQLNSYRKKKLALQNRQHILLLSDGTRIRTDNLPLLSELEYRQHYGDTLDYLFVK